MEIRQQYGFIDRAGDAADVEPLPDQEIFQTIRKNGAVFRDQHFEHDGCLRPKDGIRTRACDLTVNF